nr:hypothetical protein [Tanacetum cinerariifolium]
MSEASSAVTYTSFGEPTRSYQTEPLPPVVSPTAESPRYVDKSDPEEDPKEYEKDEIEDGYDADNEDEDEEEEEEITIRPHTSISLPPEAEVERLLAMPTPPPSPLTSLSPPSARERPVRCIAPPALPSPPLPPSLYPPPPVDRRDDIPEFEDTWIDPEEAVPEIASTTLEKVNTRVTELAELQEHDTHDLYALLKDAQDSRTRISQRVSMDSQRVDLLIDSSSDERHETRDGRHVGRVVSTTWTAEESRTARTRH